MSSNSRIVKWLVSLYRGVLRRQRVQEARNQAISLRRAVRPMSWAPRLEPLEPRLLLSATLYEETDYLAAPFIDNNIRDAFVDGLIAVGTRLDALSASSDFSTDVPGVLQYDQFFPFTTPEAKNLLDLLDGISLGGALQTFLTNPISGIGAGTAINHLNTLDIAFDFLGVEVALTTSNTDLDHISGNDYELTFDISLTVTDKTSDSLFFDLGRNADQFGIRQTFTNPYFPPFSGEIEVAAGFTVQMTAGVKLEIDQGDLDGQADGADSSVAVTNDEHDFFIRGAWLAANADIDTQNQSIPVIPTAFAMQFGFVDVDMQVMSFVLDASIRLDLDGLGTIDFDDINSISTTTAVLGDIDADIKVTVDNVGGFAGGFTSPMPTPDFRIEFTGEPLGSVVSAINASGDPRTSPQLLLNADADSYLKPFKNIDAGAIVGLLEAFADRLGTLPSSAVLSLPVPLTDGTTVGEMFPLAQMVRNALIFNELTNSDRLVDSEGNPLFASAQTLATKLDALLDGDLNDINPTFLSEEDGSDARKILFTVGFDLGFDDAVLDDLLTTDIGFDIDLGEIAGLSSEATVSLTPSGHISFTFGVDLASGGTQPIVIAPPLLVPQIRAVRDSAGNVQTPVGGVLTQRAAFKLTVGGGLGGTANVVLEAGENVSDLQAKINAALQASGVEDEPEPGRLLVEVSQLSDGRLVLSSSYTNFLSVRALASDMGGFEAELGFVENQQSSIAPTPVNGILGADAVFNLLIGTDAAATPITVFKNDTLDNTSVDGLVEDVNAALVTAMVDDRVEARKISGSAAGIMLVAIDPGVKLLQVAEANAAVETDFGWQDRQVNAEISVIGRNELVVTANGMAPSDGVPGGDVSFTIVIGGQSILVTVLQTAVADDPNTPANETNLSNTSGNATLNDLLSDINLAIAAAKLPDGRSLGTVLSAGAIDTDQDAVDDENGEAFTPDTIVLRASRQIGSFSFEDSGTSGLIGFTADQAAAAIGPVASGTLPGSATFTLTLSDNAPQQITVAADANTTIAGLVDDIQAAINANAELVGEIVVGRSGDRIVFAVPNLSNQQLRVNLGDDAAGLVARNSLGLQDGYVARADEGFRFFVQDAAVELDLEVALTDAVVEAQLGFVGITIGDSDAMLALEQNFELFDNANGTSRIFLEDMDDRLTGIRFFGDGALPSNGQLTADATFDLTVDGTTANIVISQAATGTNGNVEDLIADIQAALDAAFDGEDFRVIASRTEQGALVLTVSALEAMAMSLGAPNMVATDELGLPVQDGNSLIKTNVAAWTGDITFGGIVVPDAISGLDSLGAFSVPVSVGTGLPGVADLVPDFTSVPTELLDFADLLFSNDLGFGVVDALLGLSEFLSGNFTDLPFISTTIPVIGLSLADLLDIGGAFEDVAASFASNPTPTVQALEQRLIEALGLPSGDPADLAQVIYNGSDLLTLNLTFAKSFNRTLPVDFDLDGLPFDLQGNAGLEVEGSAVSTLVVGIDLSTPSSPSAYIDTNQTHFELEFAARGRDLNFVASIGPAGLFVSDGQFAIDADGNPGTTNDPMTFSLTLDDPDGKLNFNDGLPTVNATVVGALNARLPLFFPTDADILGDVVVTIDSLEVFFGDPTAVTIEVPDLSNIVDNFNFNLLDNLPLLIDGVDFVLGGLQGLLDDTLGNLNLPLIGGGLDDAAQFIGNLRSSVFGTLRTALDNAVGKSDQIITDALNSALAGVLPAPINASNVTKELSGDADDFVEWQFTIGDTISVDLDFDLGLPALGLESDGAVTLALTWSLDVGFGLNFNDGFYFLIDDAAGSNELMLSASISLPDTITGNLLFLSVTATDNTPEPDLEATFAIDLMGAGGDGRLTLPELGNLDANVELTAGAHLDLGLRAGIGGGLLDGKAVAALPALVTTFRLDWDLNATNPSGNFGELQYIAFENVGLDLGSFFSDFLSPLVKGIQDVTKPLQPFIDVFTAPIPVISDLAGEPFTLLDLAALFGEVKPDMIEAVANLITLINSIPTTGVNVVIPFGSVVLQDTQSMGGTVGAFDFFDAGGLDAVRDPEAPLSGFAGFGDALSGFNFDDALNNTTDGSGSNNEEAKELVKDLHDQDNFGDFIAFPFLTDPSQVLGALFGRPFVIVTLDLPPFEFGFTYSQFFPIIGPLGASITGSLGAKFDFAFGYDSFGLAKFAAGDFRYPLDLFRGFYISDGANADGSGPDVNEVEVTGSLVGAAELNLGVAKGGVGGGVRATFGLNLDDPDSDGRVRIEEIINNLKFAEPPFNPLGIFDLNIKVEAFLTWFIEVLFVFEASGQIGPSLPLLDETITIPKQPVLATKVNDDGVLRLNMGPFASDRLRGNINDIGEHLIIEQDGGTIKVTSPSLGVSTAQEFTGITRIEVMGGQGNDTLEFKNVSLPMEIDGGFGDDLIDLSTSSGMSFITGGSGNDTIKGGSGVDTVDGGEGMDLILGGDAADLLHGGAGDDTISGDGGADMIFGDAGADKLAGGADNDYIDGGAGADEIHGDATFDMMGAFIDATVAGNDTLSGGNDKDKIYGNDGNDKIGGGAAGDLIEGGLGSDTLYGDSTYDADGNVVAPVPMSEGGDRIYGEAEAPVGGDGDDTIFGEAGNDFIRGNDGMDTINAGYGADIAFGDAGNDVMMGTADADILFGGSGDDTVLGQGGSDVLFGDDGLVVYVGYPEFTGYAGDQYDAMTGNRLIGDGDPSLQSMATDDGDPLTRDLIITDVKNTDGDDTVDGAAGDDIAFGGAGDDTVIGDIDPSTIDPLLPIPVGRDILFGDGGMVVLAHRLLQPAQTVDPSDGGVDTIYGSGGDDVAFGGFAGDTIHGGLGATFAVVGSDKDVLIGDSGRVVYEDGLKTIIETTDEGVGGIDTISGNEDDDIAMGGAAGDFIHGDLADDVLIGDEGRVEITNDAQGPHITLIKTTDTDEMLGGVDDIEGSLGDDVILGGVQGDLLKGSVGADIILGDEGQLLFNLPGPDGDGDIDTLDRVETTEFQLGGDDMISGADGDDVALGGSGGDTIKGDDLLDGTPAADPGDDILIGDQGRIELFNDQVTLIITTDTEDADGGVDLVDGNDGEDVILGGVLGDFLNGNRHADILLGDEGRLVFNLPLASGGDDDAATVDIIETLQPMLGGSDVIQGNGHRDIAFGGAAGDFVYGDADSAGTEDDDDILFGDGGRASLLNGIIHRLESTDTAIGGSDYIEGNAGDDIALGGAEGDQIHGDAGDLADIDAVADGDDMLLGDNGLLNWLYSGDAAVATTIEAGFIFDSNIATLDLVTTIAPNDGGMDEIFGNAGDDGMFGGTDMDLLVGDNTRAAVGDPQFGPASSRPGQDLQFGDHGRYYPQHSYLPDFYSRNFFAIDIGFTDGGAGDLIFGNEEDDVLLGQQGDDLMFGGTGDDDMIGGHNLTSVFDDLVAIDEFQKPDGTTINDFMDGGAGDDAMAGDNAIIWRNGAAIEANDLRLRFRELTDPAGTLYTAAGLPNVTGDGQDDPRTGTTRTIFLLDHHADIEAADALSVVGSRYGNDVMAGDAGDDALFGQLGNDMIQGDGSIDDATLDIQIFEGVHDNGDGTATVTDGHDYIEGNGGHDMLMGNLGQDDIIGGSSDLFGLDTVGLGEEFIDLMRPDGGDIIFGGAATAGRISRHAFTGDVSGDDLVFGENLEDRHSADSDMILGDNGRIFRIVRTDGSFEEFNYDQTSAFENRGDIRIVVRAFEFLDYTPFDLQQGISAGDADVIRGESGDDFIHGMTGDDILYGDAEDDDIYGEREHDWMTGGTGDDGMLGDNGLVFTSRNSIAEPLYGVAATVESFIETPGDFLMQPLNVTGELKKTVDLEPFGEGGDEVMYGGLGSDWMHGGMGNDGMSGAEALPDFYNAPFNTPRVVVADIPDDGFTEMRIVPIDGLGVTRIGFYDFTNALAKLDGHFLNFENDLSLINTLGGTIDQGGHFDPNEGDGEDILYGDWGHDWLVGGTGRDHVYGGLGNDIHQNDDDLETNGGLNDAPDNGNLIPGPTGGPAEVYDNSDIAFGGGGRDLLIGNTGADRAEDWIGETNAFQAPFAPFGNGHVERQVPPHTFEFFYALSESDGADQTRIGNLTGGYVGDPLRNGEPFAELGLIIQQDRDAGFSWLEQSGAPADKQAGNTPGGKRDTRGDGLNGGTTNATATTSATVVNDITMQAVIEQSLAFWASRLTGVTGFTMDFSFSNAPVLASASLNGALVLNKAVVDKEYNWLVVLV